MEMSEESLRDFRDIIKWIDMNIMRVLRIEQRDEQNSYPNYDGWNLPKSGGGKGHSNLRCLKNAKRYKPKESSMGHTRTNCQKSNKKR